MKNYSKRNSVKHLTDGFSYLIIKKSKSKINKLTSQSTNGKKFVTKNLEKSMIEARFLDFWSMNFLQTEKNEIHIIVKQMSRSESNIFKYYIKLQLR